MRSRQERFTVAPRSSSSTAFSGCPAPLGHGSARNVAPYWYAISNRSSSVTVMSISG